MLKKFYEFIDDNVRRNSTFQGICFIIFGIIGFMLTFIFVLDSTPATKDDYAPLIEQNKAIIQEFNTVYTYDNYSISPDENNINVVLSNKQCKLSCMYDSNFNFISSKEIDLAHSKFAAIFGSVLMGFIFGGYFGTIIIGIFLPFILYYLFVFLEWLCLLLVGRRY